ncbi:MAG: hypothetical protein GXP26_01855 [Planctomycetes bacterium]|nr:hypothetical protein [Planctomycetota bacterium]
MIDTLKPRLFFGAGALMVASLFVAATVHAAPSVQPTFVAASQSQQWGGQVIPEGIPFQPSLLLTDAEQLTAVPLDTSIRVATLTADAVPDADEVAKATAPQLPPGARDGIFQKLYFTGTWLPQLNGDSLGWGDLETGIVFGFPFFRRDTPLLITPSFAVHILDGPDGADIPDRVFDTVFEFRHLRKFGKGPWAMDVAVSLGYYSDFESSESDAFRVTGRGLGVYETARGSQWVFGVGYFNRAGVSVLPIGGVILHPSPDSKWELIFPRPRISWRLPGGIPGSGDERWWYLGGEFGSGFWSIQRPISLVSDNVTYTDYRVLVGYERKITGGLSRRFEAGFVFGREFEFDSATPNLRLDDTLFVRGGFTY